MPVRFLLLLGITSGNLRTFHAFLLSDQKLQGKEFFVSFNVKQQGKDFLVSLKKKKYKYVLFSLELLKDFLPCIPEVYPSESSFPFKGEEDDYSPTPYHLHSDH